MSQMTSLGGVLFRWVLQTTWQAAVLAGLILLAQWLLRKRLSPSWRYGLWLLLVIRLLMPLPPQSALSIFNLAKTAPRHPVAVTSPPPAPAAVNNESTPTFAPNVPVFHEPREAPPFAQAPAAPRHSAKLDWFAIALCGWLGGVCFFGTRLLWANLRFRSRISAYQPISDEKVIRLFNECRAVFKLTRPVRLIESEEVESPAVYGLWQKWLLLPDGVFERFSTEELRCIFLHELAHLKRRDLAINWLVAVLQVFHWFNPVLWLAWMRMRADRELATDALALAHVGKSDHAPYGETILKVLEGMTGERALPGLVGIVENKSQLKERITAICRPGKHWKWAAITVAILIAGLGLTGAQNKTATVEKTKDIKPLSRPVVTNGAVMKVIVLDAETGKPLKDSEVLAPNQAAFWGGGENAPRWTTDKNGVALIHLGEPPANHLAQMTWFTMSVRHEGYLWHGVSWSAENKDVRPSMPGEVTVQLERGLTAGGIVQDENGTPIAGVQVHLHGTSYWGGLRHEYSEFGTDALNSPPVTTDAQGRWSVKDFPRDLEYLTMTLSGKDGYREQFTAAPTTSGSDSFSYQNPGRSFSSADLRANKLVTMLENGFTVRGLILNPTGKPLADVPVKAGFGMGNATRLEESRTDAAGKFEFRHFLHRQLIVTAYPRDFAVTSAIIDVTTNTADTRIQVAPLQPLRIRVEDGNGQPLAGATISVDGYRSEGQLLDFTAKTDRDGMAVWSNAPVSGFALTAVSPVDGVRQKIRLTPDQREITFKLRAAINKELVVTARAHDANTGTPVALDSLRFQTADREGFNGDGETAGSAFRLTVAAARFRQGGMYPQFQLQAKAKGYATLISPWRDFDEGDWSPDFALEPARRAGQIVLRPDGSPASGARVWSHFEQGQHPLFMNQPGRLYGDRLTQTSAGIDGGFELSGEPDGETVIFTHKDGFLETTLAEIKNHPSMKLQPYGRVEGILKIAGQPRQGVSVNIAPLYWNRARNFNCFYSTTTATDGSFAFTDVPAGDYKLYRHRSRRSGPITEDHQMPVTVHAGETLTVQYVNSGRQVLGKTVSDNLDLDVDWLNDDHTLTLKQAPLQQSVNLSDYASAKAFELARDKAVESPEQLRQMREARTYVLDFEQDGSFHADDVPPGTYELRIHVTKPKPADNSNWSVFSDPKNDLGLLVREVVVPAGNGPFDLGKLTVKIKADGVPEKPAVADFTGSTLDGHSVSLAGYRGKFLVLTFWAAWSDRCAEQLESVRKLQEQLSRDDRIAFLGVSLDEDEKAVRKVVEARGYKWTQAKLDAASLGKAAGNFDVNSLPAIYLLDAQGHIVGSKLEGDRLRASVERELKK